MKRQVLFFLRSLCILLFLGTFFCQCSKEQGPETIIPTTLVIEASYTELLQKIPSLTETEFDVTLCNENGDRSVYHLPFKRKGNLLLSHEIVVQEGYYHIEDIHLSNNLGDDLELNVYKDVSFSVPCSDLILENQFVKNQEQTTITTELFSTSFAENVSDDENKSLTNVTNNTSLFLFINRCNTDNSTNYHEVLKYEIHAWETSDRKDILFSGKNYEDDGSPSIFVTQLPIENYSERIPIDIYPKEGNTDMIRTFIEEEELDKFYSCAIDFVHLQIGCQ